MWAVNKDSSELSEVEAWVNFHVDLSQILAKS